MGRPRKEPPLEEELLAFPNQTEASKHYNVSTRTISRWLDDYGVPSKDHYGIKLNLDKAREIRHLHAQGQSIKSLAKKFGVTFSTISRIIHHITYPEPHPDVSDVQVIYNPSAAVVLAPSGVGQLAASGSAADMQ